MADTPNHPPLWRALKAAEASWTSDLTIPEARAIKALRDWLVPEELDPPAPVPHEQGAGTRWSERQRLRALLTTEAEIAERGDHG